MNVVTTEFWCGKKGPGYDHPVHACWVETTDGKVNDRKFTRLVNAEIHLL